MTPEQQKAYDKAREEILDAARRIASGETVNDLWLDKRGLMALPPEIGELASLRILFIHHNRLTELPEALTRLKQLAGLAVHGNRLTTLPDWLPHLGRLRELILGHELDGCPLRHLPECLRHMPQLEGLCANSCELESLPDWLEELTGLKRLMLEHNKLTALPVSLHRLAQRGTLKDLFLSDNPGLGLPDEVLKSNNPNTILDYYFRTRGKEGRELRELKMLVVGRGGAGKTTLIKRLRNLPRDPREPETHGITICPLKNFSHDDVTYICRWMLAEPTALDYRFDVKEAEKAVEAGPNLGRPSGPNAYGTADESKRAYEVSLSNRCQNPIEGIRVCYRVFLVDCVEVTEGSSYASIMPVRKLLVKAGNFELPKMTYNGSHKFTTRSHTVHKMKAANTYAGVSERDRMRGVWVRFYRHGVQVSEYKSGTVPRCDWPENKDEKSALHDDKDKQKPLLAALTAPLTEPVKPDAPATAPAPKSVAVKPRPAEKIDEKDDMPEELKIFDMSDITDDKTTDKPDAKKPIPGIPKL